MSRGLADGGGRRESCPPPRSAGVIASAQIEYISYVFITIPRARALLRRPAIYRPPPVSRVPLSHTTGVTPCRGEEREGEGAEGRKKESGERTRSELASTLGKREKEIAAATAVGGVVGGAGLRGRGRQREEGGKSEKGVATGNQA